MWVNLPQNDIRMKNVWTEVTIGGQKMPIVQLSNNGRLCLASDMNMQSCILRTKQSISKISVQIKLYKGESVESLQYLKDVNIELVREKSFFSVLGRMVGRNGLMNVKIDVFYNKAENNGICIGFISQYFQSNKYIVTLGNLANESEIRLYPNDSFIGQVKSTESQPENYIDAKDCFLKNVEKFYEVIPLTSIQKDNKIVSEWEKIIISLPLSSSLYADFQSYKQNLSAWLLHLKSWGLKQDTCKEYPGCLIDTQRYFTKDGSIDPNKQYVVLSPCWTLWKNGEGKNEEIVVSVGLIKEK